MDRCCSYGQPPGDEIYRDGAIQFWEVDGSKSKVRLSMPPAVPRRPCHI